MIGLPLCGSSGSRRWTSISFVPTGYFEKSSDGRRSTANNDPDDDTPDQVKAAVEHDQGPPPDQSYVSPAPGETQAGYSTRIHNRAVMLTKAMLMAMDVGSVQHEYFIRGGGRVPGTNGRADVVLFHDNGKIYVWEVKPLSNYGVRTGAGQLQNYIDALSGIKGKTVEAGFPISPRFFSEMGTRYVVVSAPGGIEYYAATPSGGKSPKPLTVPVPQMAPAWEWENLPSDFRDQISPENTDSSWWEGVTIGEIIAGVGTAVWVAGRCWASALAACGPA